MAICNKCGKPYRMNWTRTQPCPGCRGDEPAIWWAFGWTNWDLQRDEGRHIGAIDTAPAQAWPTAERAKQEAEAYHFRDWKEFAEEYPEEAGEYIKPVWTSYLDNGNTIFQFGDEDTEMYWVYPITLMVGK